MLSTLEYIGNKIVMGAMKIAVKLLPFREPQLVSGPSSAVELINVIAADGAKKVLIVTGSGIVKRGQLDGMIRALETHGIDMAIYDGIQPDPTFEIVYDGLALLKAENCDSVLAVGGGSAMDAAKVMALAATNKRAPEKLKGYFKGRNKPLPFYAVPTTAGTGSEVTVAAVISDTTTHKKAFIIDTRIVATAAALDPEMMVSVPAALTASTGMDALTHAIESFIGGLGDEQTEANSIEATRMIFENLPKAFADGSNLEAREALAVASYKAGLAFTKASLGYVHAISHQLGAYYGVPHGLGNAILLPHVVEFSLPSIKPKLARLAIETGIGSKDEGESILAQKVVDYLFDLNKQLGLPATVAELKAEDIKKITRGALTEAHLNYPVPRHMSSKDCQELLQKCLP
jgi:alcohol dehydrogenase class IV